MMSILDDPAVQQMVDADRVNRETRRLAVFVAQGSDYETWVRNDLERYAYLLGMVTDERAVRALEEMIQEAQERLRRLEGGEPPTAA